MDSYGVHRRYLVSSRSGGARGARRKANGETYFGMVVRKTTVSSCRQIPTILGPVGIFTLFQLGADCYVQVPS